MTVFFFKYPMCCCVDVVHIDFQMFMFRMATKLVDWPSSRTTAGALCFCLNMNRRLHKLRLKTFPSSNTVRSNYILQLSTGHALHDNTSHGKCVNEYAKSHVFILGYIFTTPLKLHINTFSTLLFRSFLCLLGIVHFMN